MGQGFTKGGSGLGNEETFGGVDAAVEGDEAIAGVENIDEVGDGGGEDQSPGTLLVMGKYPDISGASFFSIRSG